MEGGGGPSTWDVAGRAYICDAMISLMLPATLAFLVALFGMPSLIMLAKRKHLVDEPSEARKMHHRSVPTAGGVMFFAALFCSALVSFSWMSMGNEQMTQWMGVLGAGIPIFFMGLKDDIMGMGANKKLLVHMAIGLFLVVGLNLRIDNFDGLFGLHSIPFYVSAPFSWFVYIVVVNAINLIDGIDGLAGGYGMVAMMAFGLWFYWTGDLASATIAAAACGGIAGFLLFNLHPAKIFLGDSGSLLLGLLAYVFAVRILQTPNEALWANVSRPVAAMAILAYPLVDTLRVFTLRVLKRQSPFSPDRKHIHHLLMKLGWGHRLSSAAIWSYSVLFAVLAFQPQNAQMGWTGTLQFLGTLGLAFGVGTVPALLVKRGWGHSALSDTMPAESAAKATTESQPVA